MIRNHWLLKLPLWNLRSCLSFNQCSIRAYISKSQHFRFSRICEFMLCNVHFCEFLHLTIYSSGLDLVEYFAEDESISLEGSDHPWFVSSTREIIQREPYLVFGVLFLCLRVLGYIFPEVLTHLKAFWVSYVPHLNLEIFGETSQLFGRALHMVDVRRVLTKLRIYKTRNFREGAKNARVWASSLASVSLGESSSTRTSS